jgi:(p)ppGpp synthase/HD superfamily hydrolase
MLLALVVVLLLRCHFMKEIDTGTRKELTSNRSHINSKYSVSAIFDTAELTAAIHIKNCWYTHSVSRITAQHVPSVNTQYNPVILQELPTFKFRADNFKHSSLVECRIARANVRLSVSVVNELTVIVTKCCSKILPRKITAVCSQIHTTHINKLCGQNVEFLEYYTGGTYSDHGCLEC